MVVLEKLHRALVRFGRGAGLEGSEVAALAGPGIGLARVQPEFAGGQFADHGESAGEDVARLPPALLLLSFRRPVGIGRLWFRSVASAGAKTRMAEPASRHI